LPFSTAILIPQSREKDLSQGGIIDPTYLA
jgi:hypothetical protein